MDGRELREAILWEVSNDGPPYEVEVYYDGQGDMCFRGGWPRFAEDHVKGSERATRGGE
jgi:hypothetical protein